MAFRGDTVISGLEGRASTLPCLCGMAFNPKWHRNRADTALCLLTPSADSNSVKFIAKSC